MIMKSERMLPTPLLRPVKTTAKSSHRMILVSLTFEKSMGNRDAPQFERICKEKTSN
jgi:hypothetical protein